METVNVKKQIMEKALREVLEKAHVPAHQHLQLIEQLHKRIEKHDKENEQHKKAFAAHLQEMTKHKETNEKHDFEMDTRFRQFDTQVKGHQQELERYKGLAKGERGDTGTDGRDGMHGNDGAPGLKGDKGEKGDAAILDENHIYETIIQRIRKDKPIDISHIRNAKGFMKDGTKYLFEELMKGGGTTSSGSGSGYQAPLTGGLSGTNTWTTAPKVIIVDQGRAMQKTNTDGTVNWTGTTTTVLTITPTFDIYASA